MLVYAVAGQSIELSLEVSTARLDVAADGCNCVVIKADNVCLSLLRLDRITNVWIGGSAHRLTVRALDS